MTPFAFALLAFTGGFCTGFVIVDYTFSPFYTLTTSGG